jgi:hypothetical protein
MPSPATPRRSSRRSCRSELVANALLNRALANQNLGRHGKAIEDYSAAMSSETMPPPLRAVVYYNRGLSQQKLERLARPSRTSPARCCSTPSLPRPI